MRIVGWNAALVALAVAWASPGWARSEFVSKIPNGDMNSCATCHANGDTGSYNAFGDAVTAHLTGGAPNWPALYSLDSDGDGYTNGEELGDPCGVWTAGSVPAFGSGITNPGEASSVPTQHTVGTCGASSSSGMMSSSSMMASSGMMSSSSMMASSGMMSSSSMMASSGMMSSSSMMASSGMMSSSSMMASSGETASSGMMGSSSMMGSSGMMASSGQEASSGVVASSSSGSASSGAVPPSSSGSSSSSAEEEKGESSGCTDARLPGAGVPAGVALLALLFLVRRRA